jgi:hypothetical protein
MKTSDLILAAVLVACAVIALVAGHWILSVVCSAVVAYIVANSKATES